MTGGDTGTSLIRLCKDHRHHPVSVSYFIQQHELVRPSMYTMTIGTVPAFELIRVFIVQVEFPVAELGHCAGLFLQQCRVMTFETEGYIFLVLCIDIGGLWKNGFEQFTFT